MSSSISCGMPYVTCQLSKWHLCLSSLQMKASSKLSHSFCLPVTLWSVLPFPLHFLLGNWFLGKFCGFLKTWYHVLLFITAQACVSRGFMWGHGEWWNFLDNKGACRDSGNALLSTSICRFPEDTEHCERRLWEHGMKRAAYATHSMDHTIYSG